MNNNLASKQILIQMIFFQLPFERFKFSYLLNVLQCTVAIWLSNVLHHKRISMFNDLLCLIYLSGDISNYYLWNCSAVPMSAKKCPNNCSSGLDMVLLGSTRSVHIRSAAPFKSLAFLQNSSI